MDEMFMLFVLSFWQSYDTELVRNLSPQSMNLCGVAIV
jgi:hypothetical protein